MEHPIVMFLILVKEAFLSNDLSRADNDDTIVVISMLLTAMLTPHIGPVALIFPKDW